MFICMDGCMYNICMYVWTVCMYADGYIQIVLKNFLLYEFPFAFNMLDKAIDV